MNLIIYSLLLVICLGIPTPAPYIHAEGRPLNIGHRGLSSLFP